MSKSSSSSSSSSSSRRRYKKRYKKKRPRRSNTRRMLLSGHLINRFSRRPLAAGSTRTRSFRAGGKISNNRVLQEPRTFSIRLEPEEKVVSFPVFIALEAGRLSDIKLTGNVYPLSGSQIVQYSGAKNINLIREVDNKRRRVEPEPDLPALSANKEENAMYDEFVEEVANNETADIPTEAPSVPTNLVQQLQMVQSPVPVNWGIVYLRSGISVEQMKNNFRPPADTDDIIDAYQEMGPQGLNDVSIVYKPTTDLIASGTSVVAFSNFFWVKDTIRKTLSNVVVTMNKGDKIYLLLARTAVGPVIEMNANVNTRFTSF